MGPNTEEVVAFGTDMLEEGGEGASDVLDSE